MLEIKVLLCIILIVIIIRSYSIAREIHDICKPYSRLDSKLQNINDALETLTDIVDEIYSQYTNKKDQS